MRARAPWSPWSRPGQTLRIVDVGGNQAVDCVLFDAHDPVERYSAPDTIVAQGNVFLVEGTVLLSTEGRPMMTITGTSCERHDTIGGACSKESNTLRYGFHTAAQHACVENFVHELGRHGLGKRDLQSNINWFMNVPVDPDGTPRHRRRHLGARAVGRPAGRARRARGRVELPAGQQPVQRLRPDAGADGRHRPGDAWITPAARRARSPQALAGGDPDLPLAGRAAGREGQHRRGRAPHHRRLPGLRLRRPTERPVVDRLVAAGAVVVGKTNLDQFATGLVGHAQPVRRAARAPGAPAT